MRDIIEAGDGAEILPSSSPDGNGTGDSLAVRCPECGHCFARNAARQAWFDGDVAKYQCPACGRWTEGPPPG